MCFWFDSLSEAVADYSEQVSESRQLNETATVIESHGENEYKAKKFSSEKYYQVKRKTTNERTTATRTKKN